MSKQILYGSEARNKLKAGIDVGANVAKVTIGPRGRNVMSDRGILPPNITNDGLTSIQDIILKDRVENMGLDILKGVARATSEKAKGARTASIILTQAIYEEGLKHLEAGVNVIALKNGIIKAAKDVIAKLKEMAIPVTTNEEIKNVATISSESPEIGAIVASTIAEIGNDGVITIEESPYTVDTTVNIIQGMKIDKGWIDSYMVNNYEKMTAEYDNVAVIVTDAKLVLLEQFKDILEKLGAGGVNKIMVIAEEIEGEALQTFIINKLRGGYSMVGVRAPGGFGNTKKEVLTDICVLTGATLLNGDELKVAEVSQVGFAKKVIVSKEQSIILGNPEKKQEVIDRVNALKEQKKELKSKFEIQEMDARISRLSGGAAVIKIGTATSAGADYLKKKIEDAVAEAKAAIEEGIVAGGGMALGKIADNWAWDPMQFTKEDMMCFEIVKNSITKPRWQIIANSSEKAGAILTQIIDSSLGSPNNGYDSKNDVIQADMIKAGIIDPVKTLRIALENAAEAAGSLLTTEVVVADEIIKNNKE